MTGITLANAQAQLTAWLAASEACTRNQSYTIANRTLTRANLADINKQITYWQGQVQRLSRGGGVQRTVLVP